MFPPDGPPQCPSASVISCMMRRAFCHSAPLVLLSSARKALTTALFALRGLYPLLRPISDTGVGKLWQGGHHYELTNVRSWPWKTLIVVDVKPLDFDKDRDGDPAKGMVDYAIELRLSYRSKDHVYDPGQGEREQCVKLRIGEINCVTGTFTAWTVIEDPKKLECIMLGDKNLVNNLFFQSNWKVPERDEDDPMLDDGLEAFRGPTSRLRYNFEVIDDCLCLQQWSKGKDPEPEWVRVANFYVVRCLNLYQFADGSHMPYHKLLCRRLLDERGEGTVYIGVEDVDRMPNLDGAKYLDVEVLIDVSTLQKQSDVRTLFNEHHVKLDAGNLTTDMLATVMISYEQPHPDAVITRFGRQPRGLFVAGNCAYGNGELLTHEEAKVAIVPSFFDNAIMPMPRSDYPRHMLIPFPHVRYAIGLKAWNDIIPKFFQ